MDVLPFDWPRLIWGEAPPLFLAEILFRVVVIYLYTLLMLRLIGGRSVAQLSLVEFLLVIALGSAVGDSLFYPEVPLLHALAVVTFIVLLTKGLDALSQRFRRAKRLLDGEPVQVLREGALLPQGLAARDMSPSELAAFLRLEGVRNLGEVRAAYLEPMGHLSIFRADTARPGLRIEPPCEIIPHAPATPGDPAICGWCGGPVMPPAPCPACDRRDPVCPETP